MTRPHWIADLPHFGRPNKRLPLGHQQRSPYYWWWAYLRRNEEYLACCEAGGKGPLADHYKWFGDVRQDDFYKWWHDGDRGIRLFAEPVLEVPFMELDSKDQWDERWSREDVMILAVPLRMKKANLRKNFRKLLEKRHGMKQGRPKMDVYRSQAQFKLARNYTIPNLYTTLAVYDAWLANRRLPKAQQEPAWKIGKALRLNKEAIRKAESQFPDERLEGRNVLQATVGRYAKRAQAMIASAATRSFPDG